MRIRQYIYLLTFLLLSHVAKAAERPLIYVDAWKKAPYAFINDHGEPDGFDVELVKRIMTRLGMPYEIRLLPQQDVHNLIQKDSANLTLGVADTYNAPYGSFGKETICNFDVALLVKKSDSSYAVSPQQVMNMRVTVGAGSRAYHYLVNHGMSDSLINTVENMEMEILREATEGKPSALWNTMMMQWVLSRYHLNDRYIAQPVNISIGAYRFMSKDTALLSRVDSVCRIMQVEHEIDALKARWMTPKTMERDENLIGNEMLPILIGFVVLIAIVLAVGWYRRRKAWSVLTDVKTLMGLTLHSNRMKVWVYYPQTRRYAWMTRDGTVDKQYNSFEFSKFFPEKDFNIIHAKVMEFLSNNTGSFSQTLHSYDLTQLDRVIDVEVRMHALCDNYGKIYLICGVQYDITDSKAALVRMRQMHSRYKTAFDIAFGSFLRFDANGVLVAINERCRTKLGISNVKEILDSHYTIHDFGMLRDLDIDNCPDDITFCTLGKIGFMRQLIPFNNTNADNFFRSTSGNEYLENHLIKSYDMNGKLVGYILYINDITEESERLVKNKRRQIQTEKLERETNIVTQRRDYIIHKTDIRMLHYDPATKTFLIYDSEKGWSNNMTQLDILELVDPQNMQKIFKAFHKVDALDNEDIHITVATTLRNKAKQQIHMNVDAHPLYDHKGQVESYFGIMKDITSQLNISQHLKRETKRAREAEHLKQNFLKNMSYSIRQPLVTIQQNIDILEKSDDKQTCDASLSAITSNTSRLIVLSDDTLLLSRVESGLMKENKEEQDFVTIYNKVVNDTINEYRVDTVTYNVSESYGSLPVNIDKTIISRILHEVVSLPARQSTYGTVSVRYMYRKDSIALAVEGTGQSISPSTLEHIFEPRIGEAYTTDMQNKHLSGLEMPICKALLDMINGTIEIDSNPSRGTTIYVTIPA